MNRQGEIPACQLPVDLSEYVSYFWQIRGFCGSYENPISLGAIKDWQEHSYITFRKWERDFMISMDGAFRHAMSDVLKFHQSRTQVKQDDGKDKRRLVR